MFNFAAFVYYLGAWTLAAGVAFATLAAVNLIETGGEHK
jgi:hypothetical protein